MKRVFFITALALVLCLSVLAGRAHAASWRRLQTEHFTFVGDASEARLREVARELERFRTVMALALPNLPPSSPVPTVVVVFSSDGAFDPYKPRFDGRRVNVAGFFQNGEDVNYIAVNAALGSAVADVVLHEYTHSLIGNSFGVVPVWLNEGLAEFYGTVVGTKGDRAAIIGTAPRAHVDLLQQSTFIPLGQLMTVDRSSPMYNEGSRRGMFYAESWALTHYLTLGNPARRAQFQIYLSAMRQNGATEETFKSAFGVEPAVIEAEVRSYVAKFTFPALEVSFSDAVDSRVTSPATSISESEATGYLGDMLARIGDAPGARTLLEQAASRDIQAARPLAALGLLALRESRADDAVRLLEQARRLSPDEPAFAAALGRALIEQATTAGQDTVTRTQRLRQARAALAVATERAPDTAQSLALLGYVEMALRDDPPRAVALLQKAASLAPARENYRLMLGSALGVAGNVDQATREFGQLAARGSRPEVRQAAREGLAQIADLKQPKLPLRAVGPNEQRAVGGLQQIDCRAGTQVLVIDTDGRVRRFSTPRLSDVSLVSFRDDMTGAVGCGALARPIRAVVTYRPDPQGDVEGAAIAVEFVPDTFTP